MTDFSLLQLHGLLFKKSLRTHFYQKYMDAISTYYFNFLSNEPILSQYEEVLAGVVPDLLPWWMRFSFEKIRLLAFMPTVPQWLQQSSYNLLLQKELEADLLAELEESVRKKEITCSISDLHALWPPIWMRYQISPRLLAFFLSGCAEDPTGEEVSREVDVCIFWGIPTENIVMALSTITEPIHYGKAADIVRPLLPLG